LGSDLHTHSTSSCHLCQDDNEHKLPGSHTFDDRKDGALLDGQRCIQTTSIDATKKLLLQIQTVKGLNGTIPLRESAIHRMGNLVLVVDERKQSGLEQQSAKHEAHRSHSLDCKFAIAMGNAAAARNFLSQIQIRILKKTAEKERRKLENISGWQPATKRDRGRGGTSLRSSITSDSSRIFAGEGSAGVTGV
jgi:hypothetical protein